MMPLACLAIWHPWSATMGDLRVYYAAARALVGGQDIYTVPGLGLGFTYPPFAALLFAPFAIGPDFARVLITLASAASLLVIGWTTAKALHRGPVAALVIAFGALTLEPVRATLGLGQINLVLLALLMLDLFGPLPRRLRGVLIGVATGIKLTPGIFIVYLLITRQFRAAAIASGTTAGTILLSAVLMPTATIDFWTRYVFDPGRPGPAHYISNQSLRGAIARLTGGSDTPLWLLAAIIVGVAGLAIARRLHERGRELDAVVVTALTGLLVSPISWTGHWVWAAPAIALAWTHGSPFNSWRTAWPAVVTAVFVSGLPWWLPFAHDQEFHYNAVQTVIANAYLLCAAGLTAVQAVNSDARIRYTWSVRS